MEPIIITLAVVAVILIVILVLVLTIRNKVRQFSREVFGTPSLSQGLQNQKEVLAETPRSVSSMTRIYLPQIMRDFPEFNLEEYTQKANTVLKDYLIAIANKAPLENSDANNDLVNQVENIVSDLNNQNKKQHFESIVIHDTQVTRYKKSNGSVEITFQSAIEYYCYTTDETGKITNGDKSLKTQTAYDICLVYIQDADKVNEHNKGNSSVGLNCPNCGAPIKNVGKKFCEYCGTGVKEINIYSWKFNRINEKTQSKKLY